MILDATRRRCLAYIVELLYCFEKEFDFIFDFLQVAGIVRLMYVGVCQFYLELFVCFHPGF